jgi:hypothetical protein
MKTVLLVLAMYASLANASSFDLRNPQNILSTALQAKALSSSQATPIRNAVLKARIVKNTFDSNASQPAFIEKDVCTIRSTTVPVFDLRSGSAGGITITQANQCVDSDNGKILYLSGFVELAKGRLVDTIEDLKGTMVGLFVGSTPLESSQNIYSSNFSKDLNQKSFVSPLYPMLNYDCSSQPCKPTVTEYYSAIVEIED